MPRFFNITGPCEPSRHFMLSPEARLPGLDRFVERMEYFVLHAARQTGKTTAMRAFAARLREEGAVAIHASLEMSQGFTEVAEAEPTWLRALDLATRRDLPTRHLPADIDGFLGLETGARLRAWLVDWCQRVQPARVVLLLDEADVITGPAMVNLLRQLRAGFTDRPSTFPASIALIGMRDLRDYLVSAKDGVPVNPGSPFNIKAASLTMRGFTQDDVATLYGQHTEDTGQIFEADAVEAAFEWTQGQPFLVNALARIAVDDIVPDPSQPVTLAVLQEARERLIQSRTTHLDNLAQRLREPRVATLIRSILLGDERVDTTGDDFEYTRDLGLVEKGPDGPVIANPLYREVLGRHLSQIVQDNLPLPRSPWRLPDGGLAFDALVDGFVAWWRKNADILLEDDDTPYREAAAHLAFMGFLQRVVNGGGRVERDFGAGRGRVDLLVEWGDARFAVELKRVPPRHRTLDEVVEDGVAQLTGYVDTLGLTEGWLVVFDPRGWIRPDGKRPPGKKRTWDERCWRRDVEIGGKKLHLRGA